MTWLKERFPILFSPTFWGVTLTLLVFPLLRYYEVFPDEVLKILMEWIGVATGVNITWKTAKKISNK